MTYNKQLTRKMASLTLWYCLAITLSWNSSGVGWLIILYLITEGFGIGIIIISRRSRLWNSLDLANDIARFLDIARFVLDRKYTIKLLLSIVDKANAQHSDVSCWSWICFEMLELIILLRKHWLPVEVAWLNVL